MARLGARRTRAPPPRTVAGDARQALTRRFDTELFLPLAGLVDVAAECERLTREQTRLTDQITKSQNTLSNEQFVSRAKPEVVGRERSKLTELSQARDNMQERLGALPN